jgi:hypothetical protein
MISGGQTGADRAALDFALERKIPCGGWCPLGRRAEDGPIPLHYPLMETATDEYSERTELNVRDSDGTLIFLRGSAEGGVQLTVEQAVRYKKPCLIVDLSQRVDLAEVNKWLDDLDAKILNIAGPRESDCPGIYDQTKKFLHQVIK